MEYNPGIINTKSAMPMNADWNTFVNAQNLQAHADCALMDLSRLGLIRVEGDDARDFLQGQLSNDILDVGAQRGQLSSYNTHKGRMIALLWIFERDGSLYLLLPGERLDAVLKRLRMFVLRAKVTLQDASDELCVMGLSGACLEELLPQIPQQPFGTITHEALTMMRMPDALPRLMAFGPAAVLQELWRQASGSGAVGAENELWTWLNIRAGIPEVLNATAEAFIPQMIHLDRLGGISFTKGCYTGQEVVARMKYLGELKRCMYIARFESATPPVPGDGLYSAEVQSPQGAGRIVTVCADQPGGWIALVVAVISAADNQSLQLGDANGPRLEVREPTYSLTE